MEDKTIYEEYFDSIFRRSNLFSKKEYEQHCREYELNYAQFLPSGKQAKFIDVVCGAGHFLYYLKNKGYEDYLGIDISAQQIEFCKKNISQRVEKADSFEFLKNRENFYNLIVANDVLEHTPKDKVILLLKSTYKSLKPGGVFLMKTPNLGNPFCLRLRYADFTHDIGLTEKSLYQVLWIAGFRNIQILPLKEKGIKRKIVSRFIRFCTRKIMWYQGFVAPKIMTPLLVAIGKK